MKLNLAFPVAAVLIAVGGCSLFLAPSANAEVKPADAVVASRKATPEKLPEAVLQIDGMTSRVVDGIWEGTDDYWHKGDYRRCVALIRVCVAADPSFIEAYSTGVWLLWSMGDTASADALLEDGEKRSPDKGDIDAEFGWHLFNTKRYEPAATYLSRSIKVDPKQPPMTYSTYAHVLEHLGRYDEAVTVWQAQVKRYPGFSAGPANLARAIKLRDEKASASDTPRAGATSPTP